MAFYGHGYVYKANQDGRYACQLDKHKQTTAFSHTQLIKDWSRKPVANMFMNVFVSSFVFREGGGGLFFFVFKIILP